MKLYKYENYDQYVQIQTEGNKRKIGVVWVEKKTIKKIHSRVPNARSVLCHGTRNGKEQKLFREVFGDITVLGTEISDTADQFQNTVQWDFHERNEEWVGAFDVVYSNSFDHSYDPVLSLTRWKEQINTDGRIFIEHAYGEKCNVSRPLDPLQIEHEELLELFERVGLEVVATFETTGCGGAHPARVYELRPI